MQDRALLIGVVASDTKQSQLSLRRLKEVCGLGAPRLQRGSLESPAPFSVATLIALSRIKNLEVIRRCYSPASI